MRLRLFFVLGFLCLAMFGYLVYKQQEMKPQLKFQSENIEDFSTWKKVKGKRAIELKKGSETLIDDEWIVRKSDGFTMMWERTTQEKVQSFTCKGDFGKFQFWARRWDSKKNKPADRYVVFTKYALKDWPKNNEKLILSHTKAIASGLFHFPPSQYFENKPVKEVFFDTVHTDRIAKPNTEYYTVHDTEMGKFMEMIVEKSTLTRDEKNKLWAIAYERYAKEAKKPATIIEGPEFPSD